MEEIRTRLKNVLLLSAFVFFVSLCASVDEKDFKNTAKQLRESLSKVEGIKAKWEKSHIKADGMGIYYLNYEEKNKFIISKRNEWEKLSRDLKVYMTKYPKSNWTDDAHFCLVMMYLSISLGGNDYYSEAINEIKNFLGKFSNIRIEDWTKKEFKSIPPFETVFGKEIDMPDEFLKGILNLPETKRIRSLFVRAIIMELLKVGKIPVAKEELRILQGETAEGKELFAGLQNMIRRCEERAEVTFPPAKPRL